MGNSAHAPYSPTRGRRRVARGIVGGLAALALAGLSSLSVTAEAGDAPRVSVDWRKFATVLVTPPDLLFPTAPAHELSDSTGPVRWIGDQPRISLVARDWADSRRLVGDMVLTDELRPTRSSRMVVSRIHLAEGLLSPFAQLGLGEWRVDTTLLPSLPHERVLAAQAGFGFALSISPSTTLAFESDWTILQPHDSSDVLAQTHPSLWGTYFATRTSF